jgi:putative transposase
MSIENYTYKFRLQPSRLQAILLNKHIGACRFVYNHFLNLKKNHYLVAKEQELEKKNLSYADTTKLLTEFKKQEQYWFLKEANSQVLQQGLKNLDGAYNSFFKGNAEFPKFHSKNHRQSFRVPQHIKIQGNRIQIPKFMEGIKFVKHRELEYTKICNLTVTKEPTGEYYVSISVERDLSSLKDKNYQTTNRAIGIDIGIKSLAVCSDGFSVHNPKNTNKYAQKLKYAQRELNNKLEKAIKEQVFDKTGKPVYTKMGKFKFRLVISNNANKIKTKIAKIYKKISNKRKDTIHKATTKIVRNNDIICIEDLNTKGMLRNRKLSKAVADAGFGEIKTQLEYKAKWYGKEIIKISRWFPSSKTCSGCNSIKQNLKLSDRQYKCSQCALDLDRDLNASINILVQGLNLMNIDFKLQTAGTVGLACGVSSGGVLAFVNTSYDTMKQEASYL